MKSEKGRSLYPKSRCSKCKTFTELLVTALGRNVSGVGYHCCRGRCHHHSKWCMWWWWWWCWWKSVNNTDFLQAPLGPSFLGPNVLFSIPQSNKHV